jgi:GTP-binding protein EngB required for normal cell division
MLFELLEAKKKPFVIILTKCDKNEDYDSLYKYINDNVTQKFRMCSPIIHATSSK